MQIFDRLADGDYEQVVFCHDAKVGLRAIVAVHDTTLGPGLGGTRMYPYPSDGDALEDVLRLARMMTYKSAAAGLDLGGGKAVIIGDPRTAKSEGLLRAYGRFIEALGGRFITAEDVGTTQADMDLIRRETGWVTGVSPSYGGSGDPSEATAVGVLHAMRAVAAHLWGSPGLGDRHIAISGVGKVGSALAGHLAEEGARITVADVVPAAAEAMVTRYGTATVPPEKAHAVDCDLFAPCAFGGALNPATIPELRCRAVVGAANNQLADASCPARLAEAGVLWAPDFVVNAGGIINVADELDGYDPERAKASVGRIFATTAAVLAAAEAEGIHPLDAATRLAERRIASVGAARRLRVSGRQGRAGRR
ncbi:MAG: Glu/Leu/Phe/Val family dehydrogenase [Acidimicrobiales bacterium]